jgi:predicted nucleotide-binding protein
MRSERATKLLRQKLEELRKLLTKRVYHNSAAYHYYFHRWCSETEDILVQIFGEDSRQLKRLVGAVKLPSVTGTPAELSQYRCKPMLKALAELEAILASIEEYGIPEKQEGAIPPKAFISHGKESAALRKLREFIETLGIDPLIVKKLASMDKDLLGKVDSYLSQADFVIILATGDDTVTDEKTGKETKQPRQNVIHEIGLAQKVHPGRIIYLLEEGAEFPSNIRPRVWESFKQRNMTNAFLGIVRELRAYGVLKLIKPQPKE